MSEETEKLDRIENKIDELSREFKKTKEKMEEKELNLTKYGLLLAVLIYMYQTLEQTILKGASTLLFFGAVFYFIFITDKAQIKAGLAKMREDFKGKIWHIIVALFIFAGLIIIAYYYLSPYFG